MITPFEINAAISARQSGIARLRHELEIAEAKLSGMIELRDKILGSPEEGFPPPRKRAPPKINQVNEQNASYRGGRQPGAISKEWRTILSKLYFQTGHFDANAIIDAAKICGINLKHSNAKLQMAAYEKHGYIKGFDGHWKVTDLAAHKFGFLPQDSLNETPTSMPEGAS